MQAILVMFRSDGERRSFSITRDMTVIGRREDCDLRIPLGEVSRKHCRLVRDGDTLRLEDLGSSNGTYLNGQRVQQEATLNPGDSVQIGPVVFVLQVDGYPHDEALHPVVAGAADEGHAASRGSNDLGPLSPTAQSEVEDLIEGFDPVAEPQEHELAAPAHDELTEADAELGAMDIVEEEPAYAASEPPAEHGDELGGPLELMDHESHEALPLELAAPEHSDEHEHGALPLEEHALEAEGELEVHAEHHSAEGHEAEPGALELADSELLAPEADGELGTLEAGHNESHGGLLGEDGALDVLSDERADTDTPLSTDELLNLEDIEIDPHEHQPHG